MTENINNITLIVSGRDNETEVDGDKDSHREWKTKKKDQMKTKVRQDPTKTK